MVQYACMLTFTYTRMHVNIRTNKTNVMHNTNTRTHMYTEKMNTRFDAYS